MWNLFEDDKELAPLVFSNGKTQADIVKEVIDTVKEGYKVIFIKGMCGTGKSAVALNLARHLGKTSIVVPIKSLQEQYSRDYAGKKYVMHNGKKLKISPILGRNNFKCRYLEENNLKDLSLNNSLKEKNSTLTEVFNKPAKLHFPKDDKSCDNIYLPCKIEIKQKNIAIIQEFIKKNPDVDILDFDSVADIRRMTIAPICPYWSPIVAGEYELKKFKEAKKIRYKGLNNKSFIIYQRKNGCPYYEQYTNYDDSDVLIFNSLKYKIESLMDRKPLTELEIIDECDEFLDSFTIEESINLNRLAYALNAVITKDEKIKSSIAEIIDIINTIKIKYKDIRADETLGLEGTIIQDLMQSIMFSRELVEEIELDEHNYLYHFDEVVKTFSDFFNETFFSIDKKDNNIIINLVTTNLEKRFKELLDKNKVFVMMSGTIHSESVLKNIFGIQKFKIIEAEIKHQGELLKCNNGFEKDCSYASFQNHKITRQEYLENLSRIITLAKKPVLVHVNSFSDLPIEFERSQLNIDNLPTQEELIKEQIEDPFGKRINEFKEKKIDILFTTKCSRGVDFPGDTCNSIVVTRFPYPNITGLFWKILKKTKPAYFMSFYMDKARRELLQRIYRGLRSKDDKVCLLSPDSRVLDFEIE
ncbi:MAG: helicase C-terminal domain-containing protein [Nanoarchaeota archaeon]|nr:helicase C-terminal domain-containing protein [Nanoarchaeota archaeon]